MERRKAIDEWGEWRVALADTMGVDVDSVPEERRVASAEPAPPSMPAVSARRRSRLGQLMIERGIVTEVQLDEALHEQRSTGRRLGETLVEQGVITSVDFAAVL